MEFSVFLEDSVSFIQGNPIIVTIAALVIMFLIWRKPKLVLSILVIAIVFWFSTYLIISAAFSGKTQKGKLIEKGEEQIENINTR